jgi:hypothetical protein
LSGYFASTDNYLPYLLPFEYLSGFKYGLQIFVENEFTNAQPLNCFNNLESPCKPLEINFAFREKAWVSLLCLGGVIIFFQIIAFLIILVKSNKKA